ADSDAQARQVRPRRSHARVPRECRSPCAHRVRRGTLRWRQSARESLAGMVLPFDVRLYLRLVEVDLTQIAAGVARRLIVEVRRLRIAALAAGGHRPRAQAVAELDDGDEAVAAGAVHLLRPLVGARAERGERAPAR